MFLLAVLALAVLPLMIGVAQTSSGNRTLASANTFANAQLAPIRAAFPTATASKGCGEARTALPRTALPRTGVVDPAGTGLSADVAVGSCPATYPGTVTVTVRVYRTGEPSKPLVTLPTRILVVKA